MMADHNADHEQGKMDIRAQEKTFAGFISMVTNAAIIILVAVVFMALVNA